MPVVVQGAIPPSAPLPSTPRHIPLRQPRSRRAPSPAPAAPRRSPPGRPHSWGSPADLPLAAYSGRSQPHNRYTQPFPSLVIRAREESLPRQHYILLDFCQECLTTTQQYPDKNRTMHKFRAIILHTPLLSNWGYGFAGRGISTGHSRDAAPSRSPCQNIVRHRGLRFAPAMKNTPFFAQTPRGRLGFPEYLQHRGSALPPAPNIRGRGD